MDSPIGSLQVFQQKERKGPSAQTHNQEVACKGHSFTAHRTLTQACKLGGEGRCGRFAPHHWAHHSWRARPQVYQVVFSYFIQYLSEHEIAVSPRTRVSGSTVEASGH